MAVVDKFDWNREGPGEIVIPEQRYNTCIGCKYYEHRLFKSGMFPIYHNLCDHPNIPKPGLGPRELSNWDEPVRTPVDCPFLNPQLMVHTLNTEI